MSTQVDKHGLDIFKLEKSCIYPCPNLKLCIMESSMKRSGFGFQTWKFQIDEQVLGIFKTEKACIYPLTIKSVDLMKSISMKRSLIGFKHGNFKNLPKASF